MKISGVATLRGPVDRVYAALNDPAVLVRTIPGCERLERVGPDRYRMVVNAGVASVKGTYVGEVTLTDQRAPHGFVLKASGSGAPGTVLAEANVRLVGGADGTTTLTYDAHAVVGGMVGGVGQRVLNGVARKTADEFFAAVDEVLNRPAPEEDLVAAEVEPGLPVAGEPTTFVRPAAPARVGLVLPGGDFAAGAAFGAATALLGVLVGGLVARRPRPPGKG